MQVELTTEQIWEMMMDADPDGSGEIDFDEFVAALKKQMAAGGQLTSIVTSASGKACRIARMVGIAKIVSPKAESWMKRIFFGYQLDVSNTYPSCTLYKVSSHIDVAKQVQSRGLDNLCKSSSLSLNI